MTSRNASFRESVIPGLFLAPLRWLFCVVLLILGLLVGVWVIDWMLVFWVWPEGIIRLESVLAHDYRLAMEWASLQHGRPEFVSWCVNLVYGGIFETTGLHRMGVEFANAAALSIPDSVVRRAYVSGYDAIRVAMVGARLFGVRVAIIAMFIPWFLLLYALGLADGLAQRAIRRAGGGRESSSLYHRAKYAWNACMVAFVLALVLAPNLPDLPQLAAFSALMVLIPARLQWMFYKKHL